ncbi:MAG TPA: cytochrome c oxidase subunit 3 [Bryobacteraceae bacterium]|nr:cytochrome c oxidase subunit 3 [Bryobacteraceae bacterium]
MSLTIDPIAQQREKQLNGLYTIGLIGTLAFVTVTFSALIVVFVIRSHNSFNWTGIILPPVLWADTVLLIASSLTYEKGHAKLRNDDQRGFYRWTLYSFGLGVLFLLGQLAAWWQILRAGQLVTNNPHSSFFFILSGMHGLHIVVGLAGLGALLYRTHEPASGPRWQMNTRVLANAVAIFWHYLDGLWVVLFGLLLLIGR